MDEQADGPAATSRSSTPSDADESASEIARLRERLGFYESFDSLIQENVARAGQLLREAADTRASAERDVAAARDEAERRRSAQADQRALLSGLLDEVSTVQGLVERLARRVADALDEVEGHLPVGPADAGRLATGEPAAAVSDSPQRAAGNARADQLAVESESIAAESAGFVTVPGVQPATDFDLDAVFDAPPSLADEAESMLASAESTTVPPGPESPPPDMPRAPEPPVVDDPARYELETSGAPDQVLPSTTAEPRPGAVRPGTDGLPLPEPPAADPAAASTPGPADPAAAVGASVVLVHGVPRATTALSLKRYLEGLEHVGSVEPREYAEGVLRLQVISARPLVFDDLRGWADAAALEPIHVRDDLVEVRMG